MRGNLLSYVGIAVLILKVSSKTQAAEGNPPFCVLKFGEGAYTTFEPVESNRGWSVTDNQFGKAIIKKPEGLKPPTGFRCGLSPAVSGGKKCPSGTKFDNKRGGSPACLSTIFKLQELCPTEIENAWPELKAKVCKSRKYMP